MNFDWQKMTKQQKQTVALAVLVSLGLLFAIYQFVLTPFMDKGRQAAAELESLQIQLDEADRSLNGQPKLSLEYSNIVEQIKTTEDMHIAPVENPLSWVSEKVYRTARGVGVEIESVSEMASPNVPWDKGALKPGTKATRVFKPYTVQIATECTYAELLKLVAAIEDSNPYLCIMGLSISSQTKDFSKHSITITVEWPTGSIKKAVRQGS